MIGIQTCVNHVGLYIFLDIIMNLRYNNITLMNLIHQGWSKDPGSPNGGEFPRHFYYVRNNYGR